MVPALTRSSSPTTRGLVTAAAAAARTPGRRASRATGRRTRSCGTTSTSSCSNNSATTTRYVMDTHSAPEFRFANNADHRSRSVHRSRLLAATSYKHARIKYTFVNCDIVDETHVFKNWLASNICCFLSWLCVWLRFFSCTLRKVHTCSLSLLHAW